MKLNIRHLVLVAITFAGGLATYLADRYEQEHPVASIRVMTLHQWAGMPTRTKDRTYRSPALVLSTIDHDSLRTSNLPPSYGDTMLAGLLRTIPVLPVDTLRWRLVNECCAFDPRYPITLQFKALMNVISQDKGTAWTILVPHDQLVSWQNILDQNPIVERYPKL